MGFSDEISEFWADRHKQILTFIRRISGPPLADWGKPPKFCDCPPEADLPLA
jgi:hypothetical protein